MDSVRYPSSIAGCFVKGTLVHTREGLRPIEELREGDDVLSSPEDGSGAPAYKRVLKTFVHEQKTIRQVIGDWGEVGRFEMIAATGDHPFWVEGVGWTRADVLNRRSVLRLADGRAGGVVDQYPVYRTDEPGVGWTQEMADVATSHGNRYDYQNGRLLPMGGFDDVVSKAVLHSDDPFLTVTVYGIEVEDYHTYYVGKTGFWVHNGTFTHGPSTGGCFVKGTLVHTREGLRPIEELQAGDDVLSSPEDGKGDASYKRVLKTSISEQKTIRQVLADWGVVGRIEMIAATGDHPFWVEGAGWTRCDRLNLTSVLRLADGRAGSVVRQYPVYRTEEPGVGWTQSMSDVETSHGNRYDYQNAQGRPMGGFDDIVSKAVLHGDDPFLTVTVYGIEVEDYHTYYVGKTGFWVHNATCDRQR